MGVGLLELELVHRDDLALCVENYEARARGALVDSTDEGDRGSRGGRHCGVCIVFSLWSTWEQ